MQIIKERLVQTFCEMVSIDSESYYEKKMKDYLMNIFKECHMECIEMPIEGFEAGNIYAVLKGHTNKEPNGVNLRSWLFFIAIFSYYKCIFVQM